MMRPVVTLEKKLKDKYSRNYKKVFDKEFQKTVKRADQSRKILSKTNITFVDSHLLTTNGQK